MDNYFKPMSGVQIEDIEHGVKEILSAITGLTEDKWPEGIKNTPHRVAKMYEEVFQGMAFSNDEIAELFNKCFDEPEAKDLVVMSNIPAFSYCEHHMALMYNMKITVAYVPDGRVIGLSKIARIVDLVTRRLQLQERIGEDIAYIIEKICGTNNCMVVIKGEHSCMTARGISKPGVCTHTAVVHGLFHENRTLREEVYNLIKENDQ